MWKQSKSLNLKKVKFKKCEKSKNGNGKNAKKKITTSKC